MTDLYNTDQYGQVYNGPDTYRCAALDVINRNHVVLNWTDRFGSLLNILLSYAPTRIGATGGPVDGGPGKLWVGVAGHGCFAFAIGRGTLHPDYVAEKLGVRGTTASALASLISAVRLVISDTDKAMA